MIDGFIKGYTGRWAFLVRTSVFLGLTIFYGLRGPFGMMLVCGIVAIIMAAITALKFEEEKDARVQRGEDHKD
jgi:hypothetical protein